MLGAGAGAGAVSWLCTWWRQVVAAGAGAGAGCRCSSWLCAWWRQGAGRWYGLWCWCWVLCGDRAPVLGAGSAWWRQLGAVSWQCAWWRLGAGAGCNSCVKGCTVCAHTFACRNVRLSTDHCFSMFQRATRTHTHNSRAGYCLALRE